MLLLINSKFIINFKSLFLFNLYFRQPAYPTAPQMKSPGNGGNSTIHSPQNYQGTSRTMYNPTSGANNLPPTFHTFHHNQQQYSSPQAVVYPSQMPFPMPVAWPPTNQPVGPGMTNQNTPMASRRGSKHRAHSVDTGPRAHPPVNYYNQPLQQQSAATIVEHHHHRHHYHHHHRLQPTNIQTNGIGFVVEPPKEQNVPLVQNQTIHFI